MLDDYQKSEPILYKILKNIIKNSKESHAYIFDTSDYSDGYNFVIAFAKALLCPHHYTNKDQCQNCHQCLQIDTNNFPEFKIINPDGMWIKKEQLIELQEEFNKKAVIGNKKIYIINQADRLNQASSNSILKFIEEPPENIIAILITTTPSSLLPTILSRCQVYKLSAPANQKINVAEERLSTVIKFVKFTEKNGITTLLFINKLWNSTIKTKEDIISSLELIINIYKEVLNYKITGKIENFQNYQEDIIKISEKNTLKEITQKINIYANTQEKARYNTNKSMLMDKLLIELEGVKQ